MGKGVMMQKRGTHICEVGGYQVRQRITDAISKKVGGKLVTTAGSSEVFIYKGKTKIEGGMTDISTAAQKIYDILKKENNVTNVSKKVIRKYNLI